ncbi:MAG: DUF4430 domain-containing protein [Erysipelotrichales bacterium]
MRNKKAIFGVLLVFVIIGFSLFKLDLKSADEFYNQDNETSSKLDSNDSETNTLNGKLQNGNGKDGKNNNGKNSSSDALSPNGTSGSNGSSKGKGKGKGNIKVSIYIDERTLLKKEHYKKLKPELRKYVPSDGYVLHKTTIEVPSGSSAFDVLQKATRLNRIHMEYQGANDNIYNSVYIQGINHIYEFSAGGESGWMYSVNSKFPNYGLSAVTVKNGDVIRMAYTVDLGCDLGHSMKQC